jgi:hypothetical protein
MVGSIMLKGHLVFLFASGAMALHSLADEIIAPSAATAHWWMAVTTVTLMDSQIQLIGPLTSRAMRVQLRCCTMGVNLEHRLIFEFNLSTITRQPPVVAGLKFALRGAPRFPAETAVVQVLAYPSDLVESLGDFSAVPAVLLGQVSVLASQPRTLFEVNVSDQVNNALAFPTKRVAFRLQLIPETQAAQAFLDAVDTDPATKPSVVIFDSVAGDFDHDNDLDMNDFAILVSCMTGPGIGTAPGCTVCELNGDRNVDLEDLRIFEERHTLYSQ